MRRPGAVRRGRALKARAILVRFAELALKGTNRPLFERRLRRNLRAALRPFRDTQILRLRGRVLILHAGPGEPMVEALRRIPGVQSLSPALRTVGRELDEIESLAVQAVEELRRDQPAARSFRVTTRRADKTFPETSLAVDRRIGRLVLDRWPDLKVQLTAPDLELGIEIRPEGTFLFGRKVPGIGGLPVGSTGRALALLSGGIDSPVAAYLGMKRGLSVSLVFFHSAEFTGDGPRQKVLGLARVLARFQPRTHLKVVPFGAIQVAIKEAADPRYRNLLYRRFMHRLAERLAPALHASALIAGDSLGQVASQTLENLALTAQAVSLPLLRPLLTYNKDEIVLLAQKLGTFAISILPEADCCTLFQPPRPKVRGRLAEVQASEQRLEVESLLSQALQSVESHRFGADSCELPLSASSG